jgi:hypothetical protein
VHLTAPDFTILNAFALPMTAPVPREEVERLGDTKFGEMPVGSGPFRIVSYDSAAQTARFERFDDYMYPGLPYLDAGRADTASRPPRADGQAGADSCVFAGRCPRAQARCHAERPPIVPEADGRSYSCFFPLADKEGRS